MNQKSPNLADEKSQNRVIFRVGEFAMISRIFAEVVVNRVIYPHDVMTEWCHK